MNTPEARTELPTDEFERAFYIPLSPFLCARRVQTPIRKVQVPSTSLHVSEGLSAHLPLGNDPVRVMVVTGGGSRRALLRACIDRQAPNCQIDMVDSCFDAMARVGRMPAHLMVLDLGLDNVLVPALKQYLTRSAPQVALHVFDDSRDPVHSPDRCAPSVLRLQADLQAFIDTRLARENLND